MKYDYLIVGAGLFGATFAEHALRCGKTSLIIDKRSHIGGNCYTEKTKEDIDIHIFGPHIFHTNNDNIWAYVNRFAKFNNFINRPKVCFQEKIYSFPINLMTLYQLWGIKNPIEAQDKISQVLIKNDNPKNLEDWILSQVGEEIYKKFIYGYTKKQWGKEPKDLPSSIIKRLPIRLSFDDNYFTDKYQGIPENGYTSMIFNMIDGIDIMLETDYFDDRNKFDSLAKQIIYTGPIDRFFEYTHGKLEYRSLKFETTKIFINDYQGNAVINYTDEKIPFTRIVEHKHFNLNSSNNFNNITYITKEYPAIFTDNNEPFYPINNEENDYRYIRYKDISKTLKQKYIFGGRLAEYKYYDMHQIIGSAMKIFQAYQL